MANGLSEEVILSLKRQTLRDNLHFLCNNLDVDDHYIFLEDRGVLSRDSAERIRKVPCTRKDRVYEMISELSRGPSNSFDALCESIKNETVQQFMADRLLQSFEEACQSYVAHHKQPHEEQAHVNAVEPVDVAAEDEEDPLPKPGDPGAPQLPPP